MNRCNFECRQCPLNCFFIQSGSSGKICCFIRAICSVNNSIAHARMGAAGFRCFRRQNLSAPKIVWCNCFVESHNATMSFTSYHFSGYDIRWEGALCADLAVILATFTKFLFRLIFLIEPKCGMFNKLTQAWMLSDDPVLHVDRKSRDIRRFVSSSTQWSTQQSDHDVRCLWIINQDQQIQLWQEGKNS